MEPSRSWVGWVLAPIGLLVVAIAGLWLFLLVTGSALYPDAQAIPSATLASPAPHWSEPVENARRILRESISAQNLPGLSVAVGVGGELVWAEGFGWADVEAGVPVTPETRFRIGTASTVLTSAVAGVLLEQGRLSLDEEIQTYVPQFPKKQWPVTLRQLMANVGGVATDGGDERPLAFQRCEGPVEALPHFANSALLFEPGTRYLRSNYGWILVSAAVEAAADQPFLRFMTQQIFRPLGMDNTGAESSTEENPEGIGEPGEDPPPFTFIRRMILEPMGIADERARPATTPATIYSPGFGYLHLIRYDLHVMPPRNLSCYAGSMAFFSTPSDLVRFGLALNGGKLLQPATVELLQTSQQLATGEETGHGLGWDLDTVKLGGEPMVAAGYNGELLGSRVVSLRIFREAGIVVAVMSNFSPGNTSDLARRVAEAFARPAGG